MAEIDRDIATMLVISSSSTAVASRSSSNKAAQYPSALFVGHPFIRRRSDAVIEVGGGKARPRGWAIRQGDGVLHRNRQDPAIRLRAEISRPSGQSPAGASIVRRFTLSARGICHGRRIRQRRSNWWHRPALAIMPAHDLSISAAVMVALRAIWKFLARARSAAGSPRRPES